MRFTKFLLALYALSVGLSMTSCRRGSNEVWEDSKTAGRHMSRGLRTMGGKHGHSRAVNSRDEFAPGDEWYAADGSTPVQEAYIPPQDGYSLNQGNSAMGDFVPLRDQTGSDDVSMADFVSQQPRETPGDPGSSIPGISAFQDPSTNSQWAAVFKNITFEYNSNLVKGQDNLDTLRAIADYMKSHPTVYVFVEGHTDERGPEAFNLSLGSRRSNAVRNLLLQDGVNPDNVFTISYGKEKPIFHDHNEEAWTQNRRAEFKIYQR